MKQLTFWVCHEKEFSFLQLQYTRVIPVVILAAIILQCAGEPCRFKCYIWQGFSEVEMSSSSSVALNYLHTNNIVAETDVTLI